MRIFSGHRRRLTPAWAILLSITAIGAQASVAWSEDAKIAKATKTPSACAGLDIGTCRAKTECVWHKIAHLKSGKTRKAHCQKKPTRSAKKKSPPA